MRYAICPPKWSFEECEKYREQNDCGTICHGVSPRLERLLGPKVELPCVYEEAEPEPLPDPKESATADLADLVHAIDSASDLDSLKAALRTSVMASGKARGVQPADVEEKLAARAAGANVAEEAQHDA